MDKYNYEPPPKQTHLLVDALRVVVQHNQVAVGDVESRQVVACCLGVVYVIVCDVCRAACLLCGASVIVVCMRQGHTVNAGLQRQLCA